MSTVASPFETSSSLFFRRCSMCLGSNGEPIRGYTEASDLGPLLKSWGIDYDPTKIVGDRQIAQRVRTVDVDGRQRGQAQKAA